MQVRRSSATALALTVEPGFLVVSDQSESFSELVEIAKCNGDFRKHYGMIIGAYLYLRSVNAVSGRSVLWNGLMLTAIAGALAWLEKHGSSCFRS